MGHDITGYNLNTTTIKPCQDCGGCVTTGVCIPEGRNDRDLDAIRDADRLILASPDIL